MLFVFYTYIKLQAFVLLKYLIQIRYLFSFIYCQILQQQTNMISKLLPSTQFVFRALAFSQFNFNFCTTPHDPKINRQPLKLQECNSIQKIIRYVEEGDSIGIPRQANKEVLKRICLISQRGAQPFFNILTITKKIDVIDINSVDAETINYICTLYGFMSQKYVFSSNFLKSLKDRVLLMLSNPDELSDETLISLIDFSSEIEDAKFIVKACDVLKQRIPKFKYVSSFIKLLRYIQKRKAPFQKQRQLFPLFTEAVQRRMEGIKIPQMIKMYKSLCSCNSEVWDSWRLKLKIEQKIDENIENFDQKQFNELVNFSHPNNRFLSKLHRKILSEITAQGESEMGAQTILKLLNKCSQKGTKINSKQQQKLLKLILKNLSLAYRVKQYILKDTLSKRNVIKILQKICENEEYKQLYGNDCNFVGQLCIRKINHNQLIKVAIEEAEKNINDVVTDKNKFVYYTILLHRNKKQSGKDIMQIEQIKKKFEEIKGNFSHFSYLNGFKCSYRAIQYFNNVFGSYFLTDIVAAMKQQKITFRSNQLFYFVLTCNNNIIMDLLQKQNVVKQRQVMELIKKTSMNPLMAVGKFNNINSILTNYLKQRARRISIPCDFSIRNYLFNSSLHQLLQQSQFQPYFSTVLQKLVSSKSSLPQSLAHAINLSTLLKSSQQYLTFLNNIKSLIRENPGQKPYTVHQISKITRFAKQLLKYGMLDEQFLNYLRSLGVKYFDAYLQDGLLVDTDDKNVCYYLALFFRNGELGAEAVNKNLDAVHKIIDKTNNRFIQTFILNFNWKLNQVSLQILKSLFQKLTKQPSFHKLSRLIQRMSQISYTQSPYRDFLKKIADIIQKIPQKLTTKTHISLARQILFKNIPAEEYINGIMYHFDQRSQSQYDVDKRRALRLIFYLNPNKTYFLIENQCRRNRKKNYWLKLIKIVDFQNQNIVKSIKQLFKDSAPIHLDQADFDFIAHKIPEVEQFRSKLQPPTFQKVQHQFNKQILEKCCKELNVQYQIVESKGKQAIKIGNKYMAFQNDTNLFKYKAFLKQYYSFTFNIPIQNTVVMITHWRGKTKGTSQFIGQSFPEIPEIKKVYLKHIAINETERRNNLKNKNQNSSEQNSNSNSNSELNSSSSETKTKDTKKSEKAKEQDDSWQQ